MYIYQQVSSSRSLLVVEKEATCKWPVETCSRVLVYDYIYIQCRSVLRIVEIREPLGACLAHLPGRNGDFSPGTERDGFS